MQQLNPAEISEIIKQRIAKLDVAEARNEGTIVSRCPTVSCASTVWPT
jgi:F-type H+-transporting ATPase subunit alpha